MSGFFIPSAIADNIGWSLGVAAFCFALRLVGEALARRSGDPLIMRKRRFTVRALTNALLALALLGIWLSEIQNVLFSLTAVLVALVVATKELILCVSGSVLRFGGHLFKVGDRIELYGIRGEVIDHGLFSTTIMELSPREQGSMGTARTVMLPNSMLLAGPVRVEPQPRHFAPHRFTLTMEAPVPASETARLVTETAERVLSADRELAARFHQFVARKAGTEIAGPQTSVTVGTSEIGKLQFHVMIYCLVKDAPALQQEITLALFDAMEKRSGKMRDGEAKAWSEIARQLKEGAATKREAA